MRRVPWASLSPSPPREAVLLWQCPAPSSLSASLCLVLSCVSLLTCHRFRLPAAPLLIPTLQRALHSCAHANTHTRVIEIAAEARRCINGGRLWRTRPVTGCRYVVEPDGALRCTEGGHLSQFDMYTPPQAAGALGSAGRAADRHYPRAASRPLSHVVGLAVSDTVMLLASPVPAS